MQTGTQDAPPVRMRTEAAAEYLSSSHGLGLEAKTLRNWRAQGRGPRCRYLGIHPLYDRDELDRWAREEALTDTNPISAGRRARRAQKLAEAAAA
ncbi:MAG TPA: hypothetical protein VMA37_01455 [Acetobacteraceae bacterium]|nr:hypothetical protein [Acetobacteraceae bacterium]